MIRVIKWNSVDIGIGEDVEEERFFNLSKQERFKYSNAATVIRLFSNYT